MSQPPPTLAVPGQDTSMEDAPTPGSVAGVKRPREEEDDEEKGEEEMEEDSDGDAAMEEDSDDD